MRVLRNVHDYIIPETESLFSALAKLSETKNKIVFLVNEYGVLTGSFSDGDFRRWVIESKSIDLQQHVAKVANRDFVSLPEDSFAADVGAMFSERIKIIPLVDEEGRLRGVAVPERALFSVGKFNVNSDSRALIIAEIGNNHNGSLAEAKRLVDSAIASGADCVKFQMRDLETLYVNAGLRSDESADLGTQYVLDLLRKFQLSDGDFLSLFDYCFQNNIVAICTPFDKVSADKLDELNVAAFKVASADLTNHELLLHLVRKGRPMLVSTGMSTEQEIISAVDLLNSANASFVMLHCNSTYPCPFEDVNLRYLSRLQEITGDVVGYSGHERGTEISIAAVALGAKVIERHFTHDKTQEGNDHKVSLLPGEFSTMVNGIRNVERSFGNSQARTVSQGELMNRESLAKSIVASKPISSGSVIEENMLEIRSPGKGLAPYYKSMLIGKVAQRQFDTNDFFYLSDLHERRVSSRFFNINSRFGIPVRYHDVEHLIKGTNLRFVEFHLSYRDLELDPEDYLSRREYSLDCVIHAPELFSEDHILDLSSEDDDYRQRSIRELNAVLDVARKLKSFFSNRYDNALVVTNVGGFSSETFLDGLEKERKIELFKQSISALCLDGLEMIPQTMPPFPWHFGGQQFHNLFVSPEEIVNVCEETGLRICLDVSHTALACNYLGLDFNESLRRLLPYAAHLHIADAAGTGQEGLQIGDGDVDFLYLFHLMKEHSPEAYWLPEVWQGHKNDGEGFWIALERLEAFSN